jgi:hypothetical protein
MWLMVLFVVVSVEFLSLVVLLVSLLLVVEFDFWFDIMACRRGTIKSFAESVSEFVGLSLISQ